MPVGLARRAAVRAELVPDRRVHDVDDDRCRGPRATTAGAGRGRCGAASPSTRRRGCGAAAAARPAAEGEGRGAEQADAEVQQVEQQAEGDRLLGRARRAGRGTARRHPRGCRAPRCRPAAPGRWRTAGKKASTAVGPTSTPMPTALAANRAASDEHELVGERRRRGRWRRRRGGGGAARGRGARRRRSAASPRCRRSGRRSGATRRAASTTTSSDQRAGGEGEGDAGGRAEVGEAGVDDEADVGEHRQHEPAGEPLEHDRGERRRRLAVLPRQAGHPQHVAADGASAARSRRTGRRGSG